MYPDFVGMPLDVRVALPLEVTVGDSDDNGPEADDVDDDVHKVEPVAAPNELLGVVDEVPLGDSVKEFNAVIDGGIPEPEAVMLAAPSLPEDIGDIVAAIVGDS